MDTYLNNLQRLRAKRNKNATSSKGRIITRNYVYRKVKVARFTSYAPKLKVSRYTSDNQVISYNSHDAPSIPDFKMAPLEWYTFKEAVKKKNITQKYMDESQP